MEDEKGDFNDTRDGLNTASYRRSLRRQDVTIANVSWPSVVVVAAAFIAVDEGGGDVGSVSKGTSKTRAGLLKFEVWKRGGREKPKG